MKTCILMRCAQRKQNPFSAFEIEGISFFPSFYGDMEKGYSDTAPYFHYAEGGKWSGIHDFFLKYPELLNRFEYFWLVDDDILAESETVRRFVDIVSNEGFQLAQPALTPQSYWAHRITLENPFFEYRLTNFVELMMPIMRRDFLLRVLPIFKGRHAAMGMDFFWQQLTDEPFKDVAIIDAAPMTHSRPRRKLLKTLMIEKGNDIFEERDKLCAELSVHRQPPRVLGGRLQNGELLSGGVRLYVKLLAGLKNNAARADKPRVKVKDYFNLAFQQSFMALGRPVFNRDAYEQVCAKAIDDWQR